MKVTQAINPLWLADTDKKDGQVEKEMNTKRLAFSG